MTTQMLIQLIKAMNFYVSEFATTVDNRPTLDTPDGHTIVPVNYTHLKDGSFETIKAEEDTADYIRKLPFGSTIRVPIFYGDRLFATDIYNRMYPGESVNCWVHHREIHQEENNAS